jgi:hypothetical protein
MNLDMPLSGVLSVEDGVGVVILRYIIDIRSGNDAHNRRYCGVNILTNAFWERSGKLRTTARYRGHMSRVKSAKETSANAFGVG